jgi:polyphosphate kinase
MIMVSGLRADLVIGLSVTPSKIQRDGSRWNRKFGSGGSSMLVGSADSHTSPTSRATDLVIPPIRALMSAMAKKQKRPKISNEVYEAEIFRLQTLLVKLQEWTRQTGARILVIFEGRDAAGKGGAIKRITEYLSPRIAHIIALPTPTERERGQWYYQRYIVHLPSKGEIVLFDRSWYNRAGVEKVMGFCTPEEYYRFLRQTPILEQMLMDDGILVRKYWFSVSDEEQLRRFRSRHADPVRRWKLSPMDVESINRWEDYSRAKDEMMIHTDNPTSPWFVVESDIKKHARLNVIAHLLSSIPYTEVPAPEVKLPKRLTSTANYQRPPREQFTYVADYASTLLGDVAAS